MMRRTAGLLMELAALLAVSSVAHADPGSAGNAQDAPRTLEQAVARLRETMSPELLQGLRTSDETVVHELHFGAGLNVRNGWGLWARGPLYKSLKALGLQHPDDMSALILTSLWRSIHEVPWRVEEEVRLYQAYWRYAAHPDAKSNPACPGGVDVTQSYTPDLNPDASPLQDLRVLRQVHLGKCCADGRVWAYAVDRGWYSATAKERALWDAEATSRYDPCAPKAGSEHP